MQFGLMTEPQIGMTYDTLSGLARWAEATGLDAFARSDHYSFQNTTGAHATDAFASLGGLARDTATIDLVVLVSPITFRHPGVIAKTAATIDEMSGGRLRLGVGTGWMELEHTDFGLGFPERSERFERLEEALQYLHHAFGRASGPFHGKFYDLVTTDVKPAPTGALPIIVGGSGPLRTPRLAGRYADEYNFGIYTDMDEVRLRIDRARTAASDAGRDPAELMISVISPVITGADQAEYGDNMARMAAGDPFGRSAEQLADRYAQTGAPCGPADHAQEVVARLADAGVDRFYLQHFGPPDHDLLASMFSALRG